MPNDARVAFWIGVNIEYFDFNEPIRSNRSFDDPPPSPMGFGHYSYGLRVGLFRMMDSMDRHGIRGSVLLNSEVCDHYPEVIEAGNRRDWVWLAHGQRNRRGPRTFDSVDAEREDVRRMVETIERGTGHHPNGWLGPGLSESYDTPDLLAECGISYVCDWVADDQPFPISVKTGRMINVPYASDGLNDAGMAYRDLTGDDYYHLIVDQFDVLYADGAKNPRVMCLATHPHMTGQPFRAKHFDRALDYIVSHDRVWLATSDEIAAWYFDNYYAGRQNR
jgi:peptidoglycan/xylan/chitin deacetylase (PgdA/CDA1 family)